MKCNISKELFEEVFEGCVFNKINEKNNLIEYSQPCVFMEGSWVESETSINDFFFDCKEWALKQGYYITSDLIEVNIHPIEYDTVKMKSILCIDIVDNINEWDLNKHHVASSEQQAVFDACESILSNKENQCIK